MSQFPRARLLLVVSHSSHFHPTHHPLSCPRPFHLHSALETLRCLSLLCFPPSLILALRHCITSHSLSPRSLLTITVENPDQSINKPASPLHALTIHNQQNLLHQSAYPCSSNQVHLHRTTAATPNTHASVTLVVDFYFASCYLSPGLIVPITLLIPILDF